MYPEPEMCLDLQAWQEFCGFDMDGCECDLEIDINSRDLTMDVTLHGKLPAVKADEKVCTDYFGEKVEGTRAAGPFTGMEGGKIRFSIDPRRMKNT